MDKQPLVSVVMPVYNSEEFISKAIESILSQTFRDYEFIIVDGGSLDGTPAILARYRELDSRIRIHDQQNLDFVSSLNAGCLQATGKYVARMDSDDISLPRRLRKQVRFLEKHPLVGVLGTWTEYIDKKGTSHGEWHTPTSPVMTGWFLNFGTCLSHPSVLMRRDVIEHLGFYSPDALYVEDYDLWTRAMTVTQLQSIPEVLLQRRVWEGSICGQHLAQQEQNVTRRMHSVITRLLGTDVRMKVVESLRSLVIASRVDNPEHVAMVASLIRQLYEAYLEAHSLTSKEQAEVGRDAATKLRTLANQSDSVTFRRAASSTLRP